MPGHELDARGGHLVGDRHRLLRIAGVIAGGEVELFAEHAAGGVDVGDGHFAAILHLRAEGGVLAGNRPDNGDWGGVVTVAPATAGHGYGRGQSDEQPSNSLHSHLPIGSGAHSTASGKSASATIWLKPGHARSRGWCARRASDIA